MQPILRSPGTTESEKHLATLADQIFLNLWSYPNTFIDKRQHDRGDGKELCDLLVVCGSDVLVFSDKSVAWPQSSDPAVSWRRWYRRSIQKSLRQIQGALRWLDVYPDRVYLDRACTLRLPMPLPPIEERRVHGIVVARGSGKACQEFHGGGTGSLRVVPSVRGHEHEAKDAELFVVGDINPDGPFVHVLDDTTLDVVLRELDTITDFVAYFRKKEVLVRSGQLISAEGEEDMLAYYLSHMSSLGEHDFTRPDGTDQQDNDRFVIDGGQFEYFVSHRQYHAKKLADQDSYVWDRLIEAFTDNILAGTTLVPDGYPDGFENVERGVREMALVPRLERRLFGKAILEALERGREEDRFCRGLLPGPAGSRPDVGFFFLTLKVPARLVGAGYEQYRAVRRSMLEAYALSFLEKHRSLSRIIGIATEPPPSPDGPGGSSEDMVFVPSPQWTAELLDNLARRRRELNIHNTPDYSPRGLGVDEYPVAAENDSFEIGPSRPNRRQRRAARAMARRKR